MRSRISGRKPRPSPALVVRTARPLHDGAQFLMLMRDRDLRTSRINAIGCQPGPTDRPWFEPKSTVVPCNSVDRHQSPIAFFWCGYEICRGVDTPTNESPETSPACGGDLTGSMARPVCISGKKRHPPLIGMSDMEPTISSMGFGRNEDFPAGPCFPCPPPQREWISNLGTATVRNTILVMKAPPARVGRVPDRAGAPLPP